MSELDPRHQSHHTIQPRQSYLPNDSDLCREVRNLAYHESYHSSVCSFRVWILKSERSGRIQMCTQNGAVVQTLCRMKRCKGVTGTNEEKVWTRCTYHRTGEWNKNCEDEKAKSTMASCQERGKKSCRTCRAEVSCWERLVRR